MSTKEVVPVRPDEDDDPPSLVEPPTWAAGEEVPPGVATTEPLTRSRTVTRRRVPYPGTPEGAFFHYTPEEASWFLPWSALQLKRKAYAREIPFNEGGARVTYTGRDICEISLMTAVRPLAETVQQRAS
ncbi:hypothetical protein [Streptomyces sp. H27-H5]|uniref:hypothetical protein n=1 Tax=Streptomyces sp. H27-H5 TaxID=2996460 RepID=UPI00226EA3E5|nr:hypothetical protein [Streptomyces sp. H27-H5]MCY0957653.1 hypothetical protein [Streptomyces sp. H27-H5]